jgi:SAM-dependent methyltransferase
MERSVKPELLDALPPADPRAVRSRKDLERVNAWMGHCGIIARALRSTCPGRTARRVIELGAGDGRFLLRVAQRLSSGWHGTSAVLLDRLKVVSPETCRGFAALGWRAEFVQAEALVWLTQPSAPACDVMLANLFLHHFHEAQLVELLHGVARQARVFIAAEPRRSPRNRVTRHDAPVSVRAGFTGSELSRLWPAGQGWTTQERPAGWFSHLFIAQRKE